MLTVKRKSFIVAIISSVVICLVLIVNLAGYLIYLELKRDELSNRYNTDLHRLNADLYSKYIEIVRLGAVYERTGPLRGQAVLEGIVRNDGFRDISDMVIKVRFYDSDGAVLYQTIFHPQEPSLGSPGDLSQVSLPRLSGSPASSMKPEGSLVFKRVLTACPKEILSEIKASPARPGLKSRWSGKLDYEILSVTF